MRVGALRHRRSEALRIAEARERVRPQRKQRIGEIIRRHDQRFAVEQLVDAVVRHDEFARGETDLVPREQRRDAGVLLDDLLPAERAARDTILDRECAQPRFGFERCGNREHDLGLRARLLDTASHGPRDATTVQQRYRAIDRGHDDSDLLLATHDRRSRRPGGARTKQRDEVASPDRFADFGTHRLEEAGLGFANRLGEPLVARQQSLDLAARLAHARATAGQPTAAQAIEHAAAHEDERHARADGLERMVVNVVRLVAVVVHHAEAPHVDHAA